MSTNSYFALFATKSRKFRSCMIVTFIPLTTAFWDATISGICCCDWCVHLNCSNFSDNLWVCTKLNRKNRQPIKSNWWTWRAGWGGAWRIMWIQWVKTTVPAWIVGSCWFHNHFDREMVVYRRGFCRDWNLNRVLLNNKNGRFHRIQHLLVFDSVITIKTNTKNPILNRRRIQMTHWARWDNKIRHFCSIKTFCLIFLTKDFMRTRTIQIGKNLKDVPNNCNFNFFS